MTKRREKLVLEGGKRPKLRKPARKQFLKVHQEKFLDALAVTLNVTEACRRIKFSNRTVYNHRQTNAAFRAAWAEAIKEAYGRLELFVLKQMTDGTLTTKRRGDGSVETTHEYPLQIALQLLRLHKTSAAEAAAEHNPEDIEEVRERIAMRLDRLASRLDKERSG